MKATEYLKKHGIGSGTNITPKMMAFHMESYAKERSFSCMSCEKEIPINEQLIFCKDCVK